MNCRIKLDDEIETAKQYESFKQMLLRLLDDPQIQQKIGTFLRGSGLARSTGINVPQRWCS
jgi:hypothetical protein